MTDDLSARQRAIALRLGGRAVPDICRSLGRSEAWFHKWWRRYLEFGADGLYDLTRANHPSPTASRRNWNEPSFPSAAASKPKPARRHATA